MRLLYIGFIAIPECLGSINGEDDTDPRFTHHSAHPEMVWYPDCQLKGYQGDTLTHHTIAPKPLAISQLDIC